MRFLVLFIPIIFLLITGCKQEQLAPAESKSYYESYRVYLWNELILNEWNVDFVGTRHDDFKYPGLNNLIFDRDHEGEAGIETSEVCDKIDLVLLLTNNPDVVLLGVGGNDLSP